MAEPTPERSMNGSRPMAGATTTSMLLNAAHDMIRNGRLSGNSQSIVNSPAQLQKPNAPSQTAPAILTPRQQLNVGFHDPFWYQAGLTPWWREWLRNHGEDPVPELPPMNRDRRGRVVLHHPEPLAPTPVYGQRQIRRAMFRFPPAIVAVAHACGLD